MGLCFRKASGPGAIGIGAGPPVGTVWDSYRRPPGYGEAPADYGELPADYGELIVQFAASTKVSALGPATVKPARTPGPTWETVARVKVTGWP